MPKLISALLASTVALVALTSPSFAAASASSAAADNQIAEASASPAAADNQIAEASAAAPVAQGAASENKTAQSSQDSGSKALLENTAALPIRLAAVTSALVIGTPIAVARCEAKKQFDYGDAMVSELNANQFITPLMVASIPGHCLQSVAAVGTGLQASAKNAASAWNEPFTARSLSLEDLDNNR